MSASMKPIRVVVVPPVTRLVNLFTGVEIKSEPVLVEPDGFIHAQLVSGKLLVVDEPASAPAPVARKRADQGSDK